LNVHPHYPSDRSPAADALPEGPLDVAALTRRMVEDDETAYRIFYDAYFDRLSRYLLVVTAGNEEAMREALQIALVRVVRHIKVFTNEAAFWSWLTVLARSALADENRRHRRYLAFLERFTQHTAIEQSASSRDHGEERLRGLLERNVVRLPPDERQLVEWKYFAHQPVRHIAGQLQTTEKAVE